MKWSVDPLSGWAVEISFNESEKKSKSVLGIAVAIGTIISLSLYVCILTRRKFFRIK